MSARSSSSSTADQATAAPSTLRASASARVIVRLVTAIRCTSCDCRWVAVSSAISPAPTTSTVRVFKLPKILRASEIAA